MRSNGEKGVKALRGRGEARWLLAGPGGCGHPKKDAAVIEQRLEGNKVDAE